MQNEKCKMQNVEFQTKHYLPLAVSHWLLAKKNSHKGTKAQRNVVCLPVQTGELVRNIESNLSYYNFSLDVPRNPACLCACLSRLRRRQVNARRQVNPVKKNVGQPFKFSQKICENLRPNIK
jgi:hypothetical protein